MCLITYLHKPVICSLRLFLSKTIGFSSKLVCCSFNYAAWKQKYQWLLNANHLTSTFRSHFRIIFLSVIFIVLLKAAVIAIKRICCNLKLRSLWTGGSKSIDKSIVWTCRSHFLKMNIFIFSVLVLSLSKTVITIEQICCNLQLQSLRTGRSKTIDKSIDVDLPISLSENIYVFFYIVIVIVENCHHNWTFWKCRKIPILSPTMYKPRGVLEPTFETENSFHV